MSTPPPPRAPLGAVAVLPPFPLPLPLGPRSSHPPNFVASRESLEVCVLVVGDGGCWGVVEGACAVAAAWLWRSGLAGGARLGVVVRVRLLLSPVSGVRLSSPAPPWPGGAGAGWGFVWRWPRCHPSPPPVPHPVAPAAVLARVLHRFPRHPQLPSRLSSRYLARSGAEV